MSEKTYPEWEELKKENPWKIIFEKYSCEELRHLICGWQTDFVHPDDENIIVKYNNKSKESNRFVLHKLPKPYRGNLKDPKLVILSLNPGFNERVNHTMFNMLAPKYQCDFIDVCRKNLLLEDGCRIISNDVDDICDNGYWSSKLAELELNNDANLSKIGLIQFIPYASKHFNSWKDEASLRTQDFTKKIIRHILHETDARFLIMRSKAKWMKLIGNEMETHNDRFLYNDNNPRCQKLSQNNLKGEYLKIMEAFK